MEKQLSNMLMVDLSPFREEFCPNIDERALYASRLCSDTALAVSLSTRRRNIEGAFDDLFDTI